VPSVRAQAADRRRGLASASYTDPERQWGRRMADRLGLPGFRSSQL